MKVSNIRTGHNYVVLAQVTYGLALMIPVMNTAKYLRSVPWPLHCDNEVFVLFVIFGILIHILLIASCKTVVT